MNLKKNIFYQMSYQIIILVIPLLIAPYLTRVMGAPSLGIYSYVYSISYYFVLFAMLGLRNHGTRSIAACHDDHEKMSKTFWSLYFVHLILSVFAVFCYILFVLFLIKENQIIFFLLIFYVLSGLFDVTWFFYGIEKVKNIVFRNLFVKVLEIILILIFVKSSSDLWIYTVIMASSIMIGQAILLPQAIKSTKFYFPSLNDLKPHIKPLLILSISVFASSIYTMLDKTLLGILSTKSNVAFYEYSEKIVKVPLTVITSIGAVMLSNITKTIKANDVEGLAKKTKNTVILVSFLSCAFAFGIGAVSDTFSFVYYGDEFAICGQYMLCLCPILIIISLGSIIRTQYLLPLKRDYQYIIAITSCAVLNLILNFLLIPFLGVYGAIIGTIVAELTGFVIQCFFVRKDLPLFNLFLEFIPFFIIGFVMFAVIKFMDLNMDKSIMWLIIEILSGMLIYLIFSLLYILSCRKNILLNLFSFLKHRKD